MNGTCNSVNSISGASDTYSTIPVVGLAATVVDVKSGNNFPFKGFVPGVGIAIDESSNPGAITITATGAVDNYTYSTEVVPGYTATVVGTQVGQNFGFRPVAGLGDVTVDNTSIPGTLAIQSNLTYSTIPVPGIDATVVENKVGSDFRFRGFIAGAGIDIDPVSQPGAIVVSANGAPAPVPLFQNNTIFVDAQYGNNITGTRERRDLPYQTIAAAIAAAVTGDTIHVFPGSYQESNTISIPLNLYLDQGVQLSTAAGAVLTINTTNFAIAGNGSITIGSNRTGLILSSGVTSATIEFDSMTVNGVNAIGFDNRATIFESRITNLNIVIGGLMTTASPNSVSSTWVTKVKYANIAGFIFNGTGALTSCIFEMDNVISVANQALITYVSTTGVIEFRGKYIEFRQALIAPNTWFFNVSDISGGPTVRSTVSMIVDFDIFNMIVSSPILNVISGKSDKGPEINPIGQLTSKDIFIPAGASTTALFNSNNGNIIIESDDMFADFNPGSIGFALVGMLSINCSRMLKLVGSSTTLISSEDYYITAADAYLYGPIISSNGVAKCGYLECISNSATSFSGSHNIDANACVFSNSIGVIFTVAAGEIVTIEAGDLSITQPSISSIAIAGTMHISAANIRFNNSSNNGVFNLTAVTSACTVRGNNIDNISASLISNNARMEISGDRFVWNAGFGNVPFRVSSGSTLTLTAGLGRIVTGPGFTNISSSTVNMSFISLIVIGNTPSIFNLQDTTATLNFDVQNVELSPSVFSTLFTNQGRIKTRIGDILTNTNVTNIFSNSGAVSVNAQINYASLYSRLFNLGAGTALINCGKCVVNNNNVVADISGGVAELSGNMATNGTIAVNITSNPTVTIGASKIVSTATSINAPVGYNVFVVPSIAKFAPSAGVVVIGSLTVNAAIV